MRGLPGCRAISVSRSHNAVIRVFDRHLKTRCGIRWAEPGGQTCCQYNGQHDNQAEDNLTKAPAIAVRREASSWNLPQL